MTATGLLLFANDIDPAMRSEYEGWHARHHVPQRLRVPGILGAIRYVSAAAGTSPAYLTLYVLTDVAALGSLAYRRLVDEPDASTLAMRPFFRNPLRLVAEIAPVSRLPRAPHLNVARSIDPVAPSTNEYGLIAGRLVDNQANHPIMAGVPLPSGRLVLRFAPDRIPLALGCAIGGLYLAVDRYGTET
jgi:hypothetical protein